MMCPIFQWMIRHDSLHYYCDDLVVGAVSNLRLLLDHCECHVYFDDDEREDSD